ncbi:MAG: sporulation transcriptional regulator SpoIIID [Oscillospiraceae bacterium]
MDSTCERAVVLARYIVETGDTVRGAAKEFGVSKSTVHSDVSKRLRRLNPILWRECAKILQINKQERHLRGGMATKNKYALQKKTDDV